MKKIVLAFVGFTWLLSGHSQNCLDVSLTLLMNRVPKPGSASASNFGKCTTGKNSDGTQFVKDAGPDAEQLQKQIEQINKDLGNAMQQQYSSANVDEKTKEAQNQSKNNNNGSSYQNMSQQQIMEQAMQQQTGYDPKKIDKPDNLKLVMKAQQANMQISKLVAEMSQKMIPLKQKLSDDLAAADKIFPSPSQGCPMKDGHSESGGLPDCGCVRGHFQQGYNAHITAYDNYTAPASVLENNYTSLVAAQLAIIDQCINQLHNGKDLISSTYKQLLASTQTSAIGTIGGTFLGIASDIITSSGRCYCNLVNLNNETDDKLGCK